MLMFVLRWSELVTSFIPGTIHLAGNLLIIDFLQYWISLICLLIIILSTQASFQDSRSFNRSQLKILFVANFYLVIIFIGTQNIFNLFIIFEISIIPIFIIILGWGYQPEKIKAAYALFFFTAVSASPIVVILTYFFMGGSSMFLPELRRYFHYRFYGEALNFMLLCGFLVKLPIYGLHL
jgi:NADH-ubiquinone oxidoreductase chain 4